MVLYTRRKNYLVGGELVPDSWWKWNNVKDIIGSGKETLPPNASAERILWNFKYAYLRNWELEQNIIMFSKKQISIWILLSHLKCVSKKYCMPAKREEGAFLKLLAWARRGVQSHVLFL